MLLLLLLKLLLLLELLLLLLLSLMMLGIRMRSGDGDDDQLPLRPAKEWTNELCGGGDSDNEDHEEFLLLILNPCDRPRLLVVVFSRLISGDLLRLLYKRSWDLSQFRIETLLRLLTGIVSLREDRSSWTIFSRSATRFRSLLTFTVVCLSSSTKKNILW